MEDVKRVEKSQTFEARAAFSSFVVLAGIWFVIGMCYCATAFTRNNPQLYLVSLSSFTVAALWFFWLRGFKLRITNEAVVYRNGFYKSFTIPFSDITKIQNTWVEIRAF